MNIRETSDLDLDDILLVERAAFGQDTEAELVRELLNDPSAKPLLSLLAFKDDKAVGHILFTKARLGFKAPYPIPNEHTDAWMLQALRSDIIDSVGGKVICADALNKPEYWRE